MFFSTDDPDFGDSVATAPVIVRAVPEPGPTSLSLLGIIGLVLLMRKRIV